jgi:hypothetical protein
LEARAIDILNATPLDRCTMKSVHHFDECLSYRTLQREK